MTNNHGTACQCWQCQMYVTPASTTAPLPTPQPSCAECGMDIMNHEAAPPYGNRLPGCKGYRPSPSVAEPKHCPKCNHDKGWFPTVDGRCTYDSGKGTCGCKCDDRLTDDERDELSKLREKDRMHSLGDRPSSPPASDLRRMIELESKQVAEPKCDRCVFCGHGEWTHILVGQKCSSCSELKRHCPGYRPPITEPAEPEHCKVCGLILEDPRELTHECLPGFLTELAESEGKCKLCDGHKWIPFGFGNDAPCSDGEFDAVQEEMRNEKAKKQTMK